MRGWGSGKVRWVVVQSLSHVWLLQHSRLPCPSLSPRVYSSSCPLSRWCHPTISSSAALFSCPQSFPAPGSFPESALHIRRPKYWSFSLSISPSNDYSKLISFRIDWFDLLDGLSLFQTPYTESEASWCSARRGVWEGGSDHKETKGKRVGRGEAGAAGDRRVSDSPEIGHWWPSFQALHSAQGHLCSVF